MKRNAFVFVVLAVAILGMLSFGKWVDRQRQKRPVIADRIHGETGKDVAEGDTEVDSQIGVNCQIGHATGMTCTVAVAGALAVPY